MLAFDLDVAVRNLLTEQYLRRERGHFIWSFARQGYYAVKPLLSRPVQLAMRRRLVSRLAQRSFPVWPVDTSVDDLHRAVVRLALSVSASSSVPMISFWPQGADFCLVLTHDVEQQVGFDNIHLIADIERKYGFRSAWNIVPERYRVDKAVLDRLAAEGFEIGVHGLCHDGKLFQSYKAFLTRASHINVYLQEWNSVGFRSPSAIRKLDWISRYIDAEYDSSCPTTELYGAQPGGCCTVFPFMVNGVVELPYTMPEDHTLLEILTLSPDQMLETWLRTVQVIKGVHGMVLLIVHPDYMCAPQRLQAYEEFLRLMRQETNAWCALPREVARWWRGRYNSVLVQQNGAWIVQGAVSNQGRVMEAAMEREHLVIRPMADVVKDLSSD